MTLHELQSPEALRTFQKSHPNTLICFSATWCGPCRVAKPTLMDLAQSYAQDPHVQLAVGIIYENVLGDDVHHVYHIHGFPTYILFTNNGTREAGRIEGVNFDGIRQLIASAGCKRDYGVGYSLSSAASLSAEEARARRVALLEKTSTTSAQEQLNSVTNAFSEDKGTQMEVDSVHNQDADVNMSETVSQFLDPTTTLNMQDLQTLTESMGFSLIRAQKGLLHGGGGVDEAVEWIMLHQDDDDIDIPVPLVKNCTTTPEGMDTKESSSTSLVAQSYKCNECGKILSNMANLELHSTKTGHVDFEESTEAVKPLSAEEKAAKIVEIKALLKARREEREHEEKGDELEREKQRRSMGKEMTKTREQMEMDARKRDAYMRKKEKEDFKAERERIRKELEQDKLERAAHKGKLASKLGIEGYKPDGIQYDAPPAHGHDTTVEQSKNKPTTQTASAAKIDEYITKISSYKAGGDGGNCLKVLHTYIKNIVDNPSEEKFRSINMENKAYKGKVKPFVGSKSLLLAVGFNPNPSNDTLILTEPDYDLLRNTRSKLEAAMISYGC